MKRYYLYKDRPDIKPYWRLYLHPLYTGTGKRLIGSVEMTGRDGAIEHSPAEAAQGMLQGYRVEEVIE